MAAIMCEVLLRHGVTGMCFHMNTFNYDAAERRGLDQALPGSRRQHTRRTATTAGPALTHDRQYDPDREGAQGACCRCVMNPAVTASGTG